MNIKTVEELNKIRESNHDNVALRSHGSDMGDKRQVLVCTGTGCTSSGSRKIIDLFREEIKKAGLEDKITVVRTGCFGLCETGPVIIVYPEGAFYSHIKLDDVARIVKEHFVNLAFQYLFQEWKFCQ